MANVDWSKFSPADNQQSTDWSQFSPAESAAPKKQNKGIAGDLMTDLKRGVQQLPGMVTGLADIPIAAVTGEAYANKAADTLGGITGFAPSKWAKDAEAEYSPGRQAAKANIDQAWEQNQTPFADAAKGDFGGIGQIAKSYIQNPQQLVGSVVESMPSMVAGGVAAKGLVGATKLAPVIAGATGEGAVMAGQQMNKLSQTDADPRIAAGASLLTGIAGAAIGAAGGKVAQKLGVVDPETAMASGALRGVTSEAKDQTIKGAVMDGAKRVAGGAVSEGMFEELPQSVLEQALSNLAQSKPWDEGLSRAAVEGALAGSLMGGAFNVMPPKQEQKADVPPAAEEQKIAGLLPAPTYTGTPGDQIVANDAERQAAIDTADANAAKLQAERDSYEKLQAELRRNNVTIVNDPEPIQKRIDALMGIDASRLQGIARTNYEKALENAFGEQVGVAIGKDSLEAPFTMADYLNAQVRAEDTARARPLREQAGQSADTRLQQVADEEMAQQPDIAPAPRGIADAPAIPVVGTLSAVANMAVQSGAHAATQQAGIMAGIAAQAASAPQAAKEPANVPAPAQAAPQADQGNAPQAGAQAAAAPQAAGQIDLTKRTNQQLEYLSQRGQPVFKEAAIAELQKRSGEIAAPEASAMTQAVANSAPVPALNAVNSGNAPAAVLAATEQQAETGLPVATTGESRPAPVANQSDADRYAAIKATPPLQRTQADVAWANEYKANINKPAIEDAAKADKAKADDVADTDGYADSAGKNVALKQKIRNALNMVTRNNGVLVRRKDFIRSRIADGATIQTREGQRAIVSKDGAYILESALTKTAIDYAEYLAGRRDQNQIKNEAPAAATVSEEKKEPEQEQIKKDAAAKEPWQMTEAEHKERVKTLPIEQVKSELVDVLMSNRGFSKFNAERYINVPGGDSAVRDLHNAIVPSDSADLAIKQGKTIPSEVLADYPYLKTSTVNAVSQPKTDAAPEARQANAPASKPKPARNKIDPEKDSLFTAIAKAGGMDTDELLSNGIDSNDITYETSAKVKKDGQLGKKRRMPISFGFALPLHKKGGMSFDGMREAMQQYGYMPQDATKNDAIDLFRQELSGDLVYTAQAIEAQREQDQEEFDKRMQEEQDRIDNELAAQEIAESDSGFDDLSLPEQNLASDFAEFAFGENGKQDDNAIRAGMKALGFTEDEINDELAKNNQAQRESEEIATGSSQEGGAGRDGGRAEDAQTRERGGEEGFGLAGQTNDQAAEQFALQQEGEEAPTKAQADRERDAVPFSLGMQSQPKPQGVQTGLFTADGRVSADAKAAEQAPAVKEPWQMTRKEWYAAKNNDRAETFGSAGKRNGAAETAARIERKAKLNYGVVENGEPVDHRQVIEKAIGEGKSVPAEVLADYPDIKVPAVDAKKQEEAKPADDGKPDSKADSIGDFGEKIGGAKKDIWTGYKDKLAGAESLDIKAEPLSKSWPAPDYEALIESGVDSFVVAFIRSARDSIPRKPTATWKLKSWAGGVELLRDTSKKLIDGELSATQAKDLLQKSAGVSRGMRDIAGRIELYQLVGHRQSLDGISLSNHFYSIYKGKTNVDLWVVEKEVKATAFGNMPAEIATGSTKQEALDKFKALYDKVDFNQKADRAVSFDLYSQAGKFYVGKKMGRNITQLAGPFDTIKETRAYRDEHHDELVTRLEKAKEIPKVRRDSNNPRVGEDMREGRDVTPEMFAESFGFKGVEFGNWVEQKKRQKDLNDSFDALMDMAAIIGVPPKALSLNGELGLAFGARGAGGIDPAAAHYERNFVVINLTKKEGAGSLGHEWFHALDNYFSRLRSKGSDMMTEALDVSLAGRGSDFVANTAVRKEMIKAFGRVVGAIKMTAMRERSAKLDNKRSKEYWTTTPEMSARAFESYLISKLQDQNASNDYLANIVDDQTWKAAESLGFELDDSYPYPTAGEIPLIREAFDKFFQTVETKETDKGVALYNKADNANLTAADTAIYGMASEGKSAVEILKFIASASRNPFNRQLAKLLLKSGITPSVKVDSSAGWKMNAGNDKKYAAAYNPKTDMVALFRPASAERHMLHELMHAATLKALSKKGMAAGQMKALFAHVKASGKLQGMYGMSDIDEFVAEAFSNPKFQAALKQVSAPSASSGIKSGWHWFVRIVRGILGIPQGQDNALSQALDIGVGVMRENMALKEAPKNYNVRGMADKDTVAGTQAPTSAGDESTGSATIEVDGVLRSTLNSNGKPIHPTREGIKNFWRWFGDSKVVDSEGRPLIVYHGTTHDFSVFSKNALGGKTASKSAEMGFFFAGSPKTSESYITSSSAEVVSKGLADNDVSFLSVLTGRTNLSNDFISAGNRAKDAVKVISKYQQWLDLSSEITTNFGFKSDQLSIEKLERFAENLGVEKPTNWKGQSLPWSINDYRRISDAATAHDKFAGELFLSSELGDPGRIIPVYLKIDRPAVKDYKGKPFRDVKYAEFIDSAMLKKRSKHDGIVFKNTFDGGPKDNIFIVFEPDQIKSAIGNTGSFGNNNTPNEPSASAGSDDIRYNVADDYWQVSEPSKMDDVIYALQDKQIDLKRVTQSIMATGKKIRDNFNAYLQEELFHGRAAKGVKDFLDFELRPLLKEMQDQGVDMGDFEEYLWNRHAEERNKQIAKINPDMPDGGSGIDTADARAYLSGLSAEQKAKFEALAKRIDAINRNSRGILVSSGLETQETINAWNSAYQHYVPLQREDVDNGHVGTGKGFSVRGSATKRAMGSGRKVVDIVANLTMQRERNIVRAEKNRVGNALLGMAMENPNPEFWTVDKVPKERVVQNMAIYTVLDATGNKVGETTRMDEAEKVARSVGGSFEQAWGDRVTERIEPGFKSRDNVLMTRINGKDHYVTFNERDDRAMRMALAMKNLDADNLGRVLSTVGKATRFLAAVNTQYNPVFGVINLIRDTQGALINLSSTPLAGEQKRVLGYTKDALVGIYKDIRAHRAGKVPSSNWATLFEEFQKEGGQTGYRDQYANAEARAESIISELKQFKEGKAKQFTRGVFGWLSDYNETMENAVRLAAYKAAKEKGMSKQQAASLAKNLTVNFNRKGQVATQVGALYAFFNASMQGSSRLAQTLFEANDGDIKSVRLSKTGKKILVGGIMLGSMQALLLAAAGYDDDEPPEFVRERNLILPIGDGKYLTLAMPLGFHVLPGIGRVATEFVMSGGKDPLKNAASLAGMFAGAFNPIGSNGTILQTITPSVVDPIAALAENKDFTGKEIYREDFNKLNPTPGLARAKDVATVWSKAISEGLNFITGGSEFRPGLFSPSPDSIDYLIGQLTGGVGREVNKAAQTVGAGMSGEDLPLYKVPLVGRFIGDTEGQSGQSQKFYDAIKQINMHEAEYKGLIKDGRRDEALAYMAENPAVKLMMAGNHAEQAVRKLRTMKRDLIGSDADKDQILAIDERITATMKAFSERAGSVI